MEKKVLTWQDIQAEVGNWVSDKDYLEKFKYIYGVPRGGIPVAVMIAERVPSLQLVTSLSRLPKEKVLVVDDIIDSGLTRSRYQNYEFIALCQKDRNSSEWLEFPWETMSNEAPAEDSVVRMLEYIGEDPDREGLRETPKRVVESWGHLFSGYAEEPTDLVKYFTADGYDEMVLLKDIEFHSVCEHHLLPFIGKAHVAYIPDGKFLGVSKLARLLNIYSRRLQIQERICRQVTLFLMEELKPLGAACIIEAQHMCMTMRGVQKQNSIMVTSSIEGLFREVPAAREELMRLIK